jgi:hypothetical protein
VQIADVNQRGGVGEFNFIEEILDLNGIVELGLSNETFDFLGVSKS